MKSLCFVIVSAVLVSGAPQQQQQQRPWVAGNNDRFYPGFGGLGASTFAGPNLAYAGAGNFMPFGFPFGMPSFLPIPMMPFPTMSFPQPWYKGPNVCVDTKYYTAPDDVQELLDEPLIKNQDFSHESESCRGNNEVYVCTGRTMTNEGSKMYATKYKCCHGFIRSFDGRPGCVESKDGDVPPTNPNSFQQASFHSSSSSSNSKMEFVPLA